MPFFFLILLGYAFTRLKFLPDAFLQSLNKFVYKLALPLNLFYSTATMERGMRGNGRFLLFTFLLTLGSFAAVWLVTELLYRDKKLVGTLVQGGFRGYFALLGVPLAAAVVGEAAAAPAAMAIAVIIPCYNILSVLVLVIRGGDGEKPGVWKVLRGVVTNPLIIGTLLGILISAFSIPLPRMILQTTEHLAATATPLGLLSIGGLFNLKAATARLKPALYASLIKLLLQPLLLVFVCYLLGFRGEELFLFFVMFGAPVAVSSYAMASEMGGDGALASNIMIITTFFSAVTLSLGIYVMRAVGWI
jgi:predicted permease